MKLKDTTIIIQSPEVVSHEDENGNLALLDTKKEEVLYLNTTAAYTWKLLKKSKSVQDLIKAISDTFTPSDEIVVRKDLIDLLQKLAKRNFLILK